MYWADAYFDTMDRLAVRSVVTRIVLRQSIQAALAMAAMSKTLREIEAHPRYRDRTPRSPKPRIRKR